MGTRPPAVTPAAEIQLKYKQSSYDVLPKLPHTACFLAKTGSFKSIAMQWLILKGFYKAFEKVWIFSSSVFVDPVWREVGKYCEDVLGMEKWAFDTPDMEALDVSDAATTLAAPMKMRPIFGTSLRVPSLIVFGEADYHFEQVKKCIPRFESVKTMMSIELGFKIPQDDKYGKDFVEHMRYRAEGEKEPEPPQPAPVYSPSGW